MILERQCGVGLRTQSLGSGRLGVDFGFLPGICP